MVDIDVLISSTEYLSNEEGWLENFAILAPHDKFLLLLESSMINDYPYIKIPSASSFDLLLTLAILSENNYINEYEVKLKTENESPLNKKALEILNCYYEIASDKTTSHELKIEEDFKSILKDRLFQMVSFVKRPEAMGFRSKRYHVLPSSLAESETKSSDVSLQKRDVSSLSDNDMNMTPTKKLKTELSKFEKPLTPSPKKDEHSIYQNNKKSREFKTVEFDKNHENLSIFKKFVPLKDKLMDYSWRLIEIAFDSGSSEDLAKHNYWINVKPVLNLIANILILNFEPFLENDLSLGTSLYNKLLKETLIYQMLSQLGSLNSWLEDAFMKIFIRTGDCKIDPIYPDDFKIIKKMIVSKPSNKESYLGFDTISTRIKFVELIYLLMLKGDFRQLRPDTFIYRLSMQLSNVPLCEFKEFFNVRNYFSCEKTNLLIKLAESVINDSTSILDIIPEEFYVNDVKYLIDLLEDKDMVPYHESIKTVHGFYNKFQQLNYVMIFLLQLYFNENGLHVGKLNYKKLCDSAKKSDSMRQKYYTRVLNQHTKVSDTGFLIAKEQVVQFSQQNKLLKFEEFLKVYNFYD